MLRRLRRILLIVLAALVGLLAIAALSLTVALRGSLPRLDGRRDLPGVQAPVVVTRDSLGVPDIVAAGRSDAVRALGYLHAQDRFFQMDLQRRTAAGELAALLGPALLDSDRDHRRHRFRSRAQAVVAAASAREREILTAYTEGVNAGLDDLARPPLGVPRPEAAAAAVAARGHGAHHRRHVPGSGPGDRLDRRSLGQRAGQPAGRTGRLPAAARQPLGGSVGDRAAAAGRAAGLGRRGHPPLGLRRPHLAEPSRGGAGGLRRQQQLGGGRPFDRPRRRAGGQRHAPGPSACPTSGTARASAGPKAQAGAAWWASPCPARRP